MLTSNVLDRVIDSIDACPWGGAVGRGPKRRADAKAAPPL
jgi:hypothetical protein